MNCINNYDAKVFNYTRFDLAYDLSQILSVPIKEIDYNDILKISSLLNQSQFLRDTIYEYVNDMSFEIHSLRKVNHE